MHLADPAALQIHWSLVPPDDAATLAPPGCLLLALWPAPVNHDACFEAAGFTFFADNGVAWNKAAEDLLRRVIEHLSDLGASELVSAPLKEDLPWNLRPFRKDEELSLLQQAMLPMQDDALPGFHARFGRDGAALRTGNGHFLLWINLSESGPDPFRFVRSVAGRWEVVETRLRWSPLLPDATHR